MSNGWFRERYRHSLAAKGIKTSFASRGRRFDYALVDNSGKDELDQGEDYFKEVYTGSPEEIKVYLDRKGVNYTANPNDVNEAVLKFEADENINAPYLVMENGEVIDSGNMYVVEAADLYGSDKLDILIFTPAGETIVAQ